MNNIILIEDQEKFANQFVREARSKDINITHRKSLDGLKELLPVYEYKYAAVILDIKCLLHDEQEIEKADFIGAAMTYLDQTVPRFPRFILTGDDTEFEGLSKYYSSEKLFLKTPQDLDKLFADIQFCIENSEELRIKREYLSIFEIFENGWMDNQSEQQILEIIKTGLTKRKRTQFKGILADIRSMQERIYKTINTKNKLVVPDGMFKPNGMIKFNNLMKHLSGNPDQSYKTTSHAYQNQTIAQIANTIYWSCGEYIHEDPNRIYFISDNTIKSLTYGLLELMLWSKHYIK
uniref:hypothetical protein n=1 Tax=Trichocoleus desertorum TaxID=1481672 RepID=UPI0025B6018B|nr:hypothetical protein [Trichocoleus desertorum]